MKITRSQLKEIIKEELGGKLADVDIGDPDWEEWRDAHQMLISQLLGSIQMHDEGQASAEEVLKHIKTILKDQQRPDPNKDIY